MAEQTDSAAWLESRTNVRTPVRGSCFIGRTQSNTVILPDDKVSRRHAMIHAQGGQEFWLIDLGSSNGTYLNGRKVNQPCRLNDADSIEIGGHAFVFRYPQLAASVHADAATEKTIQDIKATDCWLVVADIQASTQFANNLPAEQGARLTGRWLSNCKQVIDENGGAINKFLGDGFFAYWLEKEGAAKTVSAAVKALKSLQEKVEPRFRLVVHYGQVFVGGAASLGEESLLGPEVNFVFRMEKLAASVGESCLISQKAAALLQPFLKCATERRLPVPSFPGEHVFYCA